DEAASAFKRTAGNPELMFVTRRFIVQFRPDVEHAQIEAFNSRRNVRIVERTAYMPNGFVLEAPAGEGPTGPVGLANEYFESGLTLSATPDFVRQVHTRQKTVSRSAVPRQSTADSASRPEAKNAETTPRGGEYLAHQWHLNIARVLEAWDVTIGDPSIVVAVLDDGIDVGHPEFAGKVVGESDFASHISDARPKSQNDKHGTA
ncbi:TPA: hypothetical protein KJU00_004682, partial [Shigella sonnei]|nr:hypothetical protein [Shigella sonnei]